MRTRTTTVLLLLCSVSAAQPERAGDDAPWIYRAVLRSPGGALPFTLELPAPGTAGAGAVRNGEERIAIEVGWQGDTVRLRFPPYDSTITAERGEDGGLRGEWHKRRGTGEATRMEFVATRGDAPRFADSTRPPADAAGIDGRWRVQFAKDRYPAAATLAAGPDGNARGTFETTLGDYRYLAGHWSGARLRLSCFDGAHAFLFHAELDREGGLAGDFWSSDQWHEEWNAQRDPDAALPDAFALTHATDLVPAKELRFTAVDGGEVALGDLLGERGTVLYLFGTWCPNCNDAGAVMAALHRTYAERGVRVIGLAFEHDDEPAAVRARIADYRSHHDLPFVVLHAGPANKTRASEAFPLLDAVRAYPTTVFLDGDGDPIAVHTGFSGPATGAVHARLKARFESLVERLL